MSSTLKVISNTYGNGDNIVVYETNSGTVVFEGKRITSLDLFNILQEVNGMCEYITFHELTDEQMENWLEHI